jgi:hypothetical protein
MTTIDCDRKINLLYSKNFDGGVFLLISFLW